MLADLRTLRDILVSSIDIIIDVFEQADVEFPSLHEPVQNTSTEAADLRKTSQIVDAAMKIVASAAQLIATVRDPKVSLMLAAYASHFAVALSVVEAGNVAEILRDAGPGGMHIQELAKRNEMHAKKLATAMRFLVTKHVFREVAPDVFAINSISSLLDSGLPTDGLNAEMKLTAKQGMTAEIGYTTNTALRSCSYLAEALTRADLKHSEEPNNGAFQLANKTDLAFFDWLNSEENSLTRKMYGRFMSGAVVTQPAAAVLDAFEWGSLKPGGLVCDIGGGLGHVSLEIARAFPQLRVVVQDLLQTAGDARRFWEEQLPDAIANGQVTFHGSSFLEPQPAWSTPPDVFLLRFVLHDWPDKYAAEILRHLRSAASQSTKLVVIDTIVAHACEVSEGDRNPFVRVPPEPLLKNWGEADLLAYSVGVSVLTTYNGGERTKEGIEELFATSGWKLEEICWQANASLRPSLIASPA